jgi:hypothetical protein
MFHQIALVSLAALGLAGCHIEHFSAGEDTYEGDLDPCTPESDAGGPHSTASDGGTLPTCASDSECESGFVCDPSSGACVPEPAPTCSDWQSESECSAQSGCTPVYAGVDCSCGPDCVCVGGEPGCICAAFEFFACTEDTAR